MATNFCSGNLKFIPDVLMIFDQNGSEFEAFNNVKSLFGVDRPLMSDDVTLQISF